MHVMQHQFIWSDDQNNKLVNQIHSSNIGLLQSCNEDSSKIFGRASWRVHYKDGRIVQESFAEAAIPDLLKNLCLRGMAVWISMCKIFKESLLQLWFACNQAKGEKVCKIDTWLTSLVRSLVSNAGPGVHI